MATRPSSWPSSVSLPPSPPLLLLPTFQCWSMQAACFVSSLGRHSRKKPTVLSVSAICPRVQECSKHMAIHRSRSTEATATALNDGAREAVKVEVGGKGYSATEEARSKARAHIRLASVPPARRVGAKCSQAKPQASRPLSALCRAAWPGLSAQVGYGRNHIKSASGVRWTWSRQASGGGAICCGSQERGSWHVQRCRSLGHVTREQVDV